MADEKMIAKIKALLDKAESTGFEKEADAFIAKAQELMMKYAIDDAMVRASGKKSKDEIVTRSVEVRRRFRGTQGQFLSGLARLFKCRVYFSDYGEARLPYYIVGYEGDAIFVEILFESIRAQANGARLTAGIGLRKRVECNDCGGSGTYPKSIGGGKCDTCKGKGIRQGSQGIQAHSFLEGYFSRVLARCADRYRQQVEAAGSSVALALRDKGQEVDAWMGDHLDLRKARASRARSFDGNAYGKGHDAGNKADISGGRGHFSDKPRKELS